MAERKDGANPLGNPRTGVIFEDYPETSLRNGEEGVVSFRLSIDKAGVPTDCTVIVSSSYPALDSQTCEIMMKRALFSPALDAEGRPVAGTYSNKVRWVIPKGGGE